MPLFAILGEEGVELRIRKCHINLWSLPGILRTHFYCDVGLKLSVGDKQPLRQLQIVLPFGTRGARLIDLSQLIREPRVSRLIFGEPVEISGNGILRYREESFRIRSVAAAAAPERAGRGRTAESRWTLNLQPAASVRSDYYIRVRFEVSDLSATWLWKRALLFKRIGAKVDFRVCDVRETSTTLGSDETRILPIENLYLFVVAPWSLQARSSSPSLRYIRVLERTAWTRYLDSALAPYPWTNLVVYYWRTKSRGAVQIGEATPDDERPVDPQNPFRAFLDLSHEYGPTTFLSLLLTLLVVILGLTIAARTTALVISVVGFATGALEFLWGKIVALGLAVMIFSAPVWIRTVAGWVNWTAREFDRVLARAWRSPD